MTRLVAWWRYWVLGRRWLVQERLMVRRFWWSPWLPVRIVKKVGPIEFTQEVIDRAAREWPG